MSAWALVPFKPLGAKSRLAPVLDADERAGLALRMAADVLAALRGAAGLADIALLTPSGSAEELAAEFGCRLLPDEQGAGLNGNLQRAAASLMAAGARTLLVVPADVPAITPADVEALLAAPRPGIALVAAARDGGTNALVLTPPDGIDFLFGPDSARRHDEAASRAGLPAERLDIRAFTRDVDTPEDLMELCADARAPGAARRYLLEHGICERLHAAAAPV